MVTGKNKEQFEKWYDENIIPLMDGLPVTINGFYRLCFGMQLGVYLKYYESIGKFVDVPPIANDGKSEVEWFFTVFENPTTEWCYVEEDKTYTDRMVAYKEAFIYANNLINS